MIEAGQTLLDRHPGGEAPAHHPLLLSVRQGQVGGGAQAPGLGEEGAQRVRAELPQAHISHIKPYIFTRLIQTKLTMQTNQVLLLKPNSYPISSGQKYTTLVTMSTTARTITSDRESN